MISPKRRSLQRFLQHSCAAPPLPIVARQRPPAPLRTCVVKTWALSLTPAT